ncbi:hypothetical protein BGX34_004489 [Mortierella sp. NVP85]|nr:hypothetical protein BGX34_004489 [Mortierella sp. NVP85]
MPLAKRSGDRASLNIISRDDTIRLQFSAFNTTFHLYLEPNTDFLHPEADLGPDLSHEDIKAFKGVVIQDEQYSDHKWNRASTTSRIAKRTVEHMLYEEGVVGWARMMIEHDDDSAEGLVIRGAFMVDGDTYHVTTQQHYHVQKRSDDAIPPQASSNLVVYRDSDLYKPSFSKKKRGLSTNDVACGADSMLNKTAAYIEATSSHDHYYPPDQTASIPLMGGFEMGSSWADFKTPLTKRQIAVKVAGPNPVPEGCPTNRLVNYMGVAADCAYVRSYGGQAQARKQIFADFNTASGIYESTFNVALGVIALNISSENCPTTPVADAVWNQDCSVAYTIDQRLSDFSRWRGQRSGDGAGLWHLMTKCNSGPVVGIAWTKALCQMRSQSQNAEGQGIQYTAGTGVSSITPNEWMVVAHEIGHGFGAIHDCTTASCPSTAGQCCPLSASTCDAGARYIMNPSEQTATKVFSPCSIKSICSTIASSSGQCLKPPGSLTTQEEGICGNGLKEAGEDCDCGSAEECEADPCCDGATCKFKGNAICDDLNDECCQNCQLRPAGQVCRQAISECDIQEVCTGTSPKCPPDVRVENLTPCKGANNATGLQCANGVCTSRDLQCKQQEREGITKQCGASNSCELLCNSPDGNPMSCMQIPGTYFLDGTPCGFGGTCSSGDCKYSSFNAVLNWARNHLAIVIPIGCLLGLFLLCCIWSCCCSRLCRRSGQKKVIRRSSSRRPSGTRSLSSNRGNASVYPSQDLNAAQGAQHTGQQLPPMAPVPPPPVYYDPSVLARSREEEDLQRAIEESRRDYERQMQSMSNTYPQEAPSQVNGAAAVAPAPLPRNDNPYPDSNLQAYNTNSNINTSGDRQAVDPAYQQESFKPAVPQPYTDNPHPDSNFQTYNTNSNINNSWDRQAGGPGYQQEPFTPSVPEPYIDNSHPGPFPNNNNNTTANNNNNNSNSWNYNRGANGNGNNSTNPFNHFSDPNSAQQSHM